MVNKAELLRGVVGVADNNTQQATGNKGRSMTVE